MAEIMAATHCPPASGVRKTSGVRKDDLMNASKGPRVFVRTLVALGTEPDDGRDGSAEDGEGGAADAKGGAREDGKIDAICGAHPGVERACDGCDG